MAPLIVLNVVQVHFRGWTQPRCWTDLMIRMHVISRWTEVRSEGKKNPGYESARTTSPNRNRRGDHFAAWSIDPLAGTLVSQLLMNILTTTKKKKTSAPSVSRKNNRKKKQLIYSSIWWRGETMKKSKRYVTYFFSLLCSWKGQSQIWTQGRVTCQHATSTWLLRLFTAGVKFPSTVHRQTYLFNNSDERKKKR